MSSEIYSVTMMEWFDAPTPTGRTRSFRQIGGTTYCLMVGEKYLATIRLRAPIEEAADG